MITPSWLLVAALLALGGPLFALIILIALAWLGHPPGERWVSGLVGVAFGGATLGGLLATAIVLLGGEGSQTLALGSYFALGHYDFPITLLFDGLSAPTMTFGAALTGLVGAFSARYLHREAGFYRFYLLLTLFGVGVTLVFLAGELSLIFLGWELVGLTSALLIAFFHDRQGPVRNGLRAFLTYRICDIGLLGAAVWLHHTIGSGALTPWEGRFYGLAVPPNTVDAALVGGLLLWATLGKAAQVPFGGWLPRAMEGPTPSSAIFYGALSIHLGPYLLLRGAPLLAAAPGVAMAVVVVGLLSALHGTFVGRVQTDIKSALAYASMTQVGIMLVEIGLGLHLLALVHMLGHASLRTLQILRSPSLLHDHHHLEQAMGRHLPRTGLHLERWVPRGLQPWLYRHALERGYFESILKDHLIGRIFRALRWVNALEERWVDVLSEEVEAPAPRDGELPGFRAQEAP